MRRTILLTTIILFHGLVHCARSDRNLTDLQASSRVATHNESTQADRQPPEKRSQIDVAIARHTKEFIQRQPLLATRLAIDETEAGRPYHHRLPDYSPKGMKELQSEMTKGVDELTKVSTAKLSANDALHVQIVRTIEAYFAGLSSYPAGYIDTWGGHLPYLVNQIGGPLINAPQVMQTQQRIRHLADAEAYVSRLAQFSTFVKGILTKIQADEAAGVILPKKLFPKTLAFLDRFLEAPVHEHALITTFDQNLRPIKEISAARRKQLVDSACTAMREHVYPSYRKARDFMAAQQQRASDSDGIWAQPGGSGYYQHALTYLADTNLSAGEIHEIGLAEVKRISGEMDKILVSNGLKTGSVGERMAALNRDPRFLYPDNNAARSDLLNSLNLQIHEVLRRAPKYFSSLPKAEVEVRRVLPDVEASAPGGYYNAPSLDGSRPGIYWINLRDMEAVPKFSLKTLTYHEAVPGHHFQIALNMEQTEIGLLRQQAPFNAYTEGWALYSELLAKEMGMYEDDTWGDLGRLQAELYRSVRLVVDTGLHDKRWTREKSIEYFAQSTGIAKSDVIVEVERYMVWPGQALGYKLGMIEILRLRTLAKTKLAKAFDLRAFHDLVLLPGARPMSLLRQDVERWIKQEKRKQIAFRSSN